MFQALYSVQMQNLTYFLIPREDILDNASEFSLFAPNYSEAIVSSFGKVVGI